MILAMVCELQSVMSATPGSYERAKRNVPVLCDMNIFCLSNNTKCQCVWSHAEVCVHCMQWLCALVCLLSVGKNGKRKQARAKQKGDKERHTERKPHLSDSSHKLFSVITQETRSRMVSKMERMKGWGVIMLRNSLCKISEISQLCWCGLSLWWFLNVCLCSCNMSSELKKIEFVVGPPPFQNDLAPWFPPNLVGSLRAS